MHLHNGGVMYLNVHGPFFMELQQGVIFTLQLIKVTLQCLQLKKKKTNKMVKDVGILSLSLYVYMHAYMCSV